MKRKIIWVHNEAHYVHQGVLYFLDKFFNLFLYDDKNKKDVDFGEHYKIEYYYVYNFLGTYICLIKDPISKQDKKELKIIGDLFVNLFCLKYLFTPNTSFYTYHFFRSNEGLFKKIIFYIYTMFFRNKKIIVPTMLSYSTMKNISKKVFYFPQIFYGELFDNKSLGDDKFKIIFVGQIDDRKKNVDLLMRVMSGFLDRDFEIGLIGGFYTGEHYLQKYFDVFGEKLKYYGKIPHDQLPNILTKYNIFILPSLSDPVGAVVLEAMAHSLPILVSDNVGASSYVQDGVNGFIFKSNNDLDLSEKIDRLFDIKKRMEFGKRSKQIVKDLYRHKNEKLLKNKYNELINFILD